MNKRQEIARELLERHGYVTNRMFEERGALYTARNAIAEIRPEFEAKGKAIRFYKGKTFMENKWVLEPLPAKVEESGQRVLL